VACVFFYNFVDLPSGNMAYNSNSATRTVLQDGSVMPEEMESRDYLSMVAVYQKRMIIVI
jgi:hypothetical protein